MQKIRRIWRKYRADSFEDCFIVFLVPKNPMIDPKMFALIAIGAKLVKLPTNFGRHFGFFLKAHVGL